MHASDPPVKNKRRRRRQLHAVSGGIAQLVERLPLTLKVPGSNPSRSGSEKREAGSRVITPPTSPLSRVAGSGWCM